MGLSLVLHGLALGGMAFGLKALTPPREDRATELRLIAPSQLLLRPKLARRLAKRTVAARVGAKAERTPEAPIVAAPESLKAEAGVGPETPAAPKTLMPSLSGRLGCDDALGVRLTSAQRQACADSLARLARATEPLPLDIPERKQAAYDFHVYCRQAYRQSGIPPMTEYNDDGTPVTGPSAGLGHVPGKCLGKGK